MKTLSRYFILALAVLPAFAAKADIPLDYYSSIQGLTGQQLKTALHKLIAKDSKISMLSYGSGNQSTWWGFYVTDRRADNSVVDRYSNDVRYFGSRGSTIGGMNIEHSFPKSWWGGSSNNAYKDLYNLMPCEQKINSTKSNYAMGEVTGKDRGNGCTKVGPGPWGNLWEPADKWKGDFARGYMYMVTAYQDFNYSNSEAKNIINTGAYPTLKPAASALYIKWAKNDDVTSDEVVRNDRVQSIQGNRNPFVDFPNLMEYIWGDSIGTPFNINTTRKGGSTSGSVTPGGDTPLPGTIYENSLLGDEGDFTVDVTDAPSGNADVWVNTSNYGWKGTGFIGGKKLACSADLVSPEIDLTNYKDVKLTFDHAVNFSSNPAGELTVLIREIDETETELTVPVWPSGDKWSFLSSGDIDLTDFRGGRVNIIFRYTSTTQNASTWEIKNLSITGTPKNSGLENLPEIDPDSNSKFPVEWYSLDGRAIDPASYKGVAIRRQGSSVSKHLLR